MEPITADKGKNVSRVCDTLRDEIIRLDLLPGSRISENDLAERFGLSRTPIRQALAELQKENLVVIRPQRRTTVALIDLDYVLELIYMRLAVESSVLRDVVGRPHEGLIESLNANLAEQRRVVASQGSGLMFYELDARFHRLVFESAGKPLLWEIIQEFRVHYLRFRMLDVVKKHELGALLNEHEAYFNLIERGEATEIDRLMHEHLYGGVRRLRDRITADLTSYFTPESAARVVSPEFDALLQNHF
jgi:DNA-binding GntR family transcriptional regulator